MIWTHGMEDLRYTHCPRCVEPLGFCECPTPVILSRYQAVQDMVAVGIVPSVSPLKRWLGLSEDPFYVGD